jgi:putative transposase
MIKGVKLRLYPNTKQRDQLTQMFGNSRFIWNIMLNMANERYQNNPSSSFVNGYGMDYLLPRLKEEYPFLKESESYSLQASNHYLAQSLRCYLSTKEDILSLSLVSLLDNLIQAMARYGCHIIAKRYMRLPKLGSIKTSKTNQLKGL